MHVLSFAEIEVLGSVKQLNKHLLDSSFAQ